MLSSIHPLGERSRSNRYWLTLTAYVAGSLLGGAATGAAAGAIGQVLGLDGASTTARAAVVGVGATAALLADLRSRPLTHVHRQVDKDWMQEFRGWVYGLGYGVQLGTGLVTIVSTATVYLWIAVAVLSGSIVTGAVLGAAFGLARGAVLLAGARLDSPEVLRTFHRRLDDLRRGARMATLSGTAVVLVVAVAVGTFGIVAA